ncbi:ABC transporter permease [Cellulomonas soli]|uniref:ABC transporter ATP-binding protein n=1 Tax=Cellulomonas soli TaxID=931535 RepID=A0A512P854_9CELL|nr:ABC transporter permease [Cellulomonas soli]NYI57599.1 putative ABC transport system permease protein [Cellulomonas soli]GEP67376.1 ABC transporter ATP-binding protein [Cellulomonas soli]
MLRLTLAQMRRSVGRLAAAGIAIAISAAFLTATLLAGKVMTRAGYDAVTAMYAQADLVVAGDFTSDDVATARDLPGVAAADPLLVTGVPLEHGSRTVWQPMLATTSDPRLSSLELVDGSLPTTSGQVALEAGALDRLGLKVGDPLTLEWTQWSDDPDTEPTEHTVDLQVVGEVSDPNNAWTGYGGAGVALAEDLQTWSAGSEELPASMLVATDDLATARAELAQAFPGSDVKTRDEAAAAQIAQMSGQGNVLLMVVLGFAAVALLVAALVISNTFQVLVAQRTRTLALLRAVGAVRGQLRMSVVTEAAILGLTTSALGVLLGGALTQLALSAAGGMDLGVRLPTTIDVDATVVLVPLLVGTLVTVLASLVPARAATRVSPVEALRPADAPTTDDRAGRFRLVFSVLLVVLGLLGLAGGAGLAMLGAGDPMGALGVAVLGGALSFVGVLVGCVFWVPKVVSLTGRLIARTGPSARLAAANTLRNPRRTAATSTALLIGVTLVTLMTTGAVTTEASMSGELDTRYAVDVAVAMPDGDGDLPSSAVSTLGGVDGVRQVVQLTSSTVTVDGAEVLLLGLEPSDASVLRDPALLRDLDDGAIVLADGIESLADSDVSTVTGDAGSADLEVLEPGLGGSAAVVTKATLAGLDPSAGTTTAWLSLDGSRTAAQVVQDVTDAFPDTALEISSGAVEREQYTQVLDTLLAIVVGLLAVAVVIALIGVANTLSLSVIERRRESATLRAIGLTRSQLRTTLAVEGVLIAGVGAVLGMALGILYGWAGAATVFAGMGPLHLAVPWLDLAIVLLVACAAGLLASVVPGRAAARTSPVAALAVD